MFTVALIGADGAGKSTVSRRLEYESSLPVKYIYMGVNLEASGLVLPTTRLILELKRLRGGRPDIAGPSDPSIRKPRPRNPLSQAVQVLKSTLRLANLMAEEWFRQAIVWYRQRQGYIVVFDRHFFTDYYAHDITENGTTRSLARRIHGLMLQRFYPKPDLLICLDAPAEVLLARKGEGTVTSLDRRRQEYLQLRHVVEHFEVVDATQPEDEVMRQVMDLILAFHHRQLPQAIPGQPV
jgi:thymidylate kinase